MQNPSVEEIQLDIEDAKSVVSKADALIRLMNNTDFKKIIREGYFREEAIRLVELKASPHVRGPEQQQSILLAIDAIGQLQQHFNQICVMAEHASAAIDSSQDELEEMALEGEV